MAVRRKLIVVSNRGPVVYDRAEEGDRIARRGGGGLVTALRSLVEHHDVTWIASAMSEEDRLVAEEARGEPIEEVARGGASYRLRLVAHDPTAYDWYYNVIANPMLWFIQHYLWGLTAAPNVDHGLHHAWSEGYVVVNQCFADAVVDELEREPDADSLLPRLPPLRCPGARAGADARGASGSLRARPLADAGLLAGPPGADPARDPRRPTGQRRDQLPHAPLAAQLPAFLRGHPRGRAGSGDLRDSARGPRGAAARAADLARPRRVRRARGQRGRARRRGGDRGRTPRVSRSPRRSHGSVEERRPRLPGLRALPRRPSGDARAGPDACAARSLSPGHPRVRRVSGGHPARRPRRQRPLPARGLGAARPADPGQLHRRRSRRTSSSTSCS